MLSSHKLNYHAIFVMTILNYDNDFWSSEDVGISESWEAVNDKAKKKYLRTGQRGHISLSS